jgi:hypothetical protein
MREFLALLVKLVLDYGVVHVFLDSQDLTILGHGVSRRAFWDRSKQFFDVSVWTREDYEFLRIQDAVESRHFLEESLKVKPSLIDKLDVFVSYGLLWWQHWQRNTWPSLFELLVQLVELIVSSITLPHALAI